jgi:hypothetical protein
MPEIDEKLRTVFGKRQSPAPLEIVKTPPKPKRYLADISIAIQAQRIYDPNRPPAPPTKPATAQQADTGTAPNMDMKSKWDKGNG